MFFHRVTQGVFQIMLDIGVDGQPQAVALGRKTLGLIALLQRVAPGVHRREHYAVFAGEQVVVPQLQSRDARIVHIGEAQHRGQQLSLRVPPPGVLIDADAGDAVFFAEVPHPVGRLPVHAVAQEAVVGAAVTELFQELALVQLQYFGKAMGRKGEFVLRHLPGRGPDRPAAAVGGEEHSVCAEDLAPVGRDDGVPQLLAEGTVGV